MNNYPTLEPRFTEKELNKAPSEPLKFLIWGGNGWIGSMLKTLLEEQGYSVIVAKARLEDYPAIIRELETVNPNFVLNAAGITGRPTVDWCEDHKQETLLINTVGTINLAAACWKGHYHLTNYATGCIYTYDIEHPVGSLFTELDVPNFRGSTYSTSKVLAEQALASFDNVLTLRLRMPVSDDLHPKSLVTKISKYPKILNIPNSISILSELLPISLQMAQRRLTGIYNFTNPGIITHNEILTLYKQYIDPNITWTNFTEAEQNTVLKSRRSNCGLDTSKLTALYPVTEIHAALEHILKMLQSKLQDNKN